MIARYFVSLLLAIFVMPVKADSLGAADALKQLIERGGESLGHAASNSPGKDAKPNGTRNRSGGVSEALLANETLDGFIKRMSPGLPSKEIWVRKTYVDLNPQAFVGGNPNLLRPGVTLNVPHREDLRKAFTASHPAIAALFDEPPLAAKSPEEKMQRGEASRWVRFP